MTNKKLQKRLKRFHRDIYYPPWAEESLNSFIEAIRKNSSTVFSPHSVEKVVKYSFRYGSELLKYLLKSIRKTSLVNSLVFEFKAKDQIIQRACFRFTFEQFPVDLVLVISSDGTIVTVFTINKGDNHSTLDTTVYEKGV